MTRPIKILFTIPNFDTAGSGKVVYDLVKGLDKTQFAPEICCTHTKGAFFKIIESLQVPIHVFDVTANYRPYASLPFRILKIARFFKAHQFHLIHSWHWSSDFTEPLASKLAGIPFVYTKKAMGWGNKAWVWRSKLSTKIIAINSDMRYQFFKNMTDKVVELPLGVDTNYYQPQVGDANLRAELEIDPSDFVVVSVANLVPIKGIEVLLDAIQLLDDATMKVVVVGDDTNDYGRHLKQTYTSTNIKFVGKQINVRPYLAIADLFVIPTKNEGRKEGLPIAPLEAMASGCVVLGSNISGIKDILKQFPDCLFEGGNIRPLADKIIHFKEMPSKERNAIGNAMRQYVETHYTIHQFVVNHAHCYQSILKVN